MIGNIVCVVIPYKDFKEKIKITKQYKGNNIEIYKNYILIIDRKGRLVSE